MGSVWYGKRKSNAITGKLEKQDKANWIINKGLHQAIIPEGLFEEVQQMIGDKSKKPTRSNRAYLLSRILWCDKCGGKMHGYTYHDKLKNKTYSYYKCHNHTSKGASVCEGLSIPTAQLEEFIVGYLADLEKDKKFMADKKKLLKALESELNIDSKEIDSRLKVLAKKESELERRKAVLLDKLEKEVIDDETFKSRFDAISSELGENRLAQESLGGATKDKEIQRDTIEMSFEGLSSFKEGWEYLDDESKAAKLRTIVKSVAVTEENINLEIYLSSDSLEEMSRTDTGSSRRRA